MTLIKESITALFLTFKKDKSKRSTRPVVLHFHKISVYREKLSYHTEKLDHSKFPSKFSITRQSI